MSNSIKTNLILAKDYPNELINSINNAVSRICIIATNIRADSHESRSIIDALCRASDRGVSVKISADVFTYLEPKEFRLIVSKEQSARVIQSIKLKKQLKEHNISFTWLGKKTNSLANGRTHCKWSVVDDTCYTFGGLNIDNDSFNNLDYIFKITNKALADELVNEFTNIRKYDKKGGGIYNHSFILNDKNTVLFDGGLIGKSIIYNRVCKLANQASEITLVSQYCPTGKLNKILHQKKSHLYFNNWQDASFINRAIIRVGLLSAKSETLYTGDKYLHAKFVIFKMPNGETIALTGSHNFMFSSGIIGTREIALETSDSDIISQLQSFLDNHVK